VTVTVAGSLNADLIVTVDRLPGRGETVVGRSAATGPGGKGANQAAAAAGLAAGVAMVGRVGDDEAGRRQVAELAGRGVDVSGVRPTPGVPTGAATVAVEQGTGENLIVVAPGANGEVTPADVEVAAVREAGVVLLQLEIPLPAVEAAARAAHGLVVLNPAPPQPLPTGLLDRVDVLVPNEWELAALVGADAPPEDTDALAALARRVTPGPVVVTLGARGALVVEPGAAPELVPAPTVAVVDTTGAGDCFCGALCVALDAGAALPDAVRSAVAAAAESTTWPGARRPTEPGRP
jgi:ribokinase